MKIELDLSGLNCWKCPLVAEGDGHVHSWCLFFQFKDDVIRDILYQGEPLEDCPFRAEEKVEIVIRKRG